MIQKLIKREEEENFFLEISSPNLEICDKKHDFVPDLLIFLPIFIPSEMPGCHTNLESLQSRKILVLSRRNPRQAITNVQ